VKNKEVTFAVSRPGGCFFLLFVCLICKLSFVIFLFNRWSVYVCACWMCVCN